MRFNQIFLILLLGSLLTSLMLPPAAADHVRGKLDMLYWPVAVITRGIAAGISGHMTSVKPAPVSSDGKVRTTADMQDEIDSLKWMLGNVTRQLEDMRKLNREMRDLGPVGDSSVLFSAWAGDAGNRKTLNIGGTSSNGLRPDMPVICSPLQLVGRLQNVSLTGSRVIVITDPKYPAIQGEFRRYEKDSGFTTIKSLPFTVIGEDGTLHVHNLKMNAVKSSGLKPGDMACLADTSYPELVQGVPIGEVSAINENAKNPLFADIVLKTQKDLMRLREVLVVIGKKRPVQ